MLNAYLTDTVILKTATYDKWGTATFISTAVKSRVEYETKMVRNLAGQEVVSTAQITMKDRVVNHKDIITIDGVDRNVINITKQKDFSANKVLIVAVA